MAGVRTSLTEAQIESRRNHYLERIGQGKPKAKGTKNNPLKNKDLARMLQERFGRKGNKPQKKGTGEAITQLNQQASQTPAVNAETATQSQKPANRPATAPKPTLTHAEAHQIQNMVSDESLANLQRAKANLEAEEAAAKKTKPEANAQQTKAETPAQKKSAQPKTWKSYYEARGMEYTQPKSGVGEADRRAAEIIKQNEQRQAAQNSAQTNIPPQKKQQNSAQTNIPPQKKQAEPKTWKKYLNERGMEYTQPKSGVGEADRRAAEIIKQNEQKAAALRQEALYHAERINKPFTTSAAQIDKQLGMGHKYPVSPDYAEEYAKLMDEKYGKLPEHTAPAYSPSKAEPPVQKKPADKNKKPVIPSDEAEKPVKKKPAEVPSNNTSKYMDLLDEKYGKESGNPSGVPPQKPGKPAEGAAEKAKNGGKDAVKDSTKKPGFFKRIGNAMKGKKGKFALAAAAVAVLAGAAALIKGCSDDNKKNENIVTPTPTPVIPDKDEKPKESRYDVLPEEGKMPKAYTIKAGDYPSAIIEATYGVKYGTPEFNAIKEAVYAASEYQPNTNIYAGDKFTLPDVEFNGKVYSANPEAEVKPGIVKDNGLKLAHTKEVVKEADKFYIIYKETGEKVPNEPAFDSEDAARNRILELDAQDAENEEVPEEQPQEQVA